MTELEITQLREHALATTDPKVRRYELALAALKQRELIRAKTQTSRNRLQQQLETVDGRIADFDAGSATLQNQLTNLAKDVPSEKLLPIAQVELSKGGK